MENKTDDHVCTYLCVEHDRRWIMKFDRGNRRQYQKRNRDRKKKEKKMIAISIRRVKQALETSRSFLEKQRSFILSNFKNVTGNPTSQVLLTYF